MVVLLCKMIGHVSCSLCLHKLDSGISFLLYITADVNTASFSVYRNRYTQIFNDIYIYIIIYIILYINISCCTDIPRISAGQCFSHSSRYFQVTTPDLSVCTYHFNPSVLRMQCADVLRKKLGSVVNGLTVVISYKVGVSIMFFFPPCPQISVCF